MRQYFTGFFTALCLATSLYFFISSDSSSSEEVNLPIIIEDDKGKVVINSESIRFYNKEKEEILFVGSTVREAGSIQIKNNRGYKVVNLGAWYGDGFNGNGSITVNNAYGNYGWSVIGKVSEVHYQ